MDLTWILPQVSVEVKEDLTLELRPIKILDQGVKTLWNKKILIVKILWWSVQIEEETWERESKTKKKYPEVFELLGMEYETS